MIYNGILWFCCLYISNSWWRLISVNWGPSIAIHISLPRLMSLILDLRWFKWVWFQQKWVCQTNVWRLPPSFLNSSPPQKKILWVNNLFAAARGSFALYYFSAVYRNAWSFPLKLLVRWVSLLSWASLMKTALTSTVSLHELHMDLLKLYISTCMSYTLAHSYWYYAK